MIAANRSCTLATNCAIAENAASPASGRKISTLRTSPARAKVEFDSSALSDRMPPVSSLSSPSSTLPTSARAPGAGSGPRAVLLLPRSLASQTDHQERPDQVKKVSASGQAAARMSVTVFDGGPSSFMPAISKSAAS